MYYYHDEQLLGKTDIFSNHKKYDGEYVKGGGEKDRSA